MLRRAPNSITLQESDVHEFKIRTQRRMLQKADTRTHDSKDYSPCAEDSHLFNARVKGQRRPLEDEKSGTFTASLTIQIMPSSQSSSTMSNRERAVALLSSYSNTSGPIDRVAEDHTMASRPFSPENEGTEVSSSRLPAKEDEIGHTSFADSLSEDDGETRSSSFAPEDFSLSPPHNAFSRIRSRMTLPRSPLYLSQNASSSPEQRLTSGLTPRVVSRVASHNTPGMMFAQPARRPPQSRTFRHQANSFSNDSNDRSDSVYESERTSRLPMDDGTTSPQRSFDLDEELGGASLIDTQPTGHQSTSEPTSFGNVEVRINPQGQDSARDRFGPLNASPSHLPSVLAISHGVTGDQTEGNSQTSSLTKPSSSPRSKPEDSTISQPCRPDVERASPATRYSTSSMRGYSPMGFLERLTRAYRDRSPGQHGLLDHVSPSMVTSLPRSQHLNIPRNPQQHTPGQLYQVYSDILSPDTQPQTPAHLPEARHQSRYHPSYTAPADVSGRRRSSRVNGSPSSFATPTRRSFRGGRSGSPIGLTTSGFQGLYGGRENGDDERNWVDGVRAGHPDINLIGSRDARNDGRRLNETPEREEFRPAR